MIRSVEQFTRTGTGQSRVEVPVDFIKTRPFAGKRLRSRFMNILSRLPLAVLKRSTAEYFLYRKYIDAKIVEELAQLKDSSSSLEGILDTKLNAKLDAKVYEMMKLTDALKSELMAEINKDVSPLGIVEDIKPKVLNENRVSKLKKLNLGSGSHILEDYVNVDHREIKGVDLVADIRHLPFEDGTMEEIFLSHVFEHFTELQARDMVKYWYGLLKTGGMLRIIVPDIENMVLRFADGSISWDRLRKVVLGGQDYNSDYHFNMFSEKYLKELLTSCASDAKVSVVASARPNGEALELEIHLKKPEKG